MDNQPKEYSEDDSFDTDKTAAEYGNDPNKMGSDMTGNKSFEDRKGDFKDNDTTGSGYSEAERATQDGTNSDLQNGSDELIDKYNINDKAHHDSSKEDFVNTVSNFRHADSEQSEDIAKDDYKSE